MKRPDPFDSAILGPRMKFYLPFAREPAAAEDNWRRVRRKLAERGFPTEERRVWMLGWRTRKGYSIAEVGAFVREIGEPAILILKARGKPLYYVCTPGRGILSGDPLPVRDTKHTMAADFEEGHAWRN